MKAGWEVKPLEQCLDKFRVVAKIPRKKFEQSGSFPIISQESEFVNGYWNDEDDVCQIDNPVVIFGDHTQVLKYVDFNFVVGADGVKVLNPKAFLNPKFLQYFIEANPFTSLGYARHFRHIKSLPIPLPPLEEQKRIVAVLDGAFDALTRARAHVEANLDDSEQVVSGSLDEMNEDLALRNGRVAIDEIAAVKGGKRLPKGSKTSQAATPHPYISVKNFTDGGTVSTEKLGYISEEIQRGISRYTISSQDVYVSIAGTIGKSGIVPNELDGANLTENAAKLVLNDGWAAKYVYWCTRSTDFSTQAFEQTRTAAQPKLALQRLGAILVPKASGSEQVVLCEKMNAMKIASVKLNDAYLNKLTDLDELRQSLLQKAFAGELT